MPFTQANAAQACTFVHAKIGSRFGSMKCIVVLAFAHEGSEITHPGSLHNAEVLSASATTRPK